MVTQKTNIRIYLYIYNIVVLRSSAGEKKKNREKYRYLIIFFYYFFIQIISRKIEANCLTAAAAATRGEFTKNPIVISLPALHFF